MDTGEQPYDDRHGPRPKAVDPQGKSFELSIPDAIDAVREYRQVRRAINPRAAEAMRVVCDELEQRFNAEQAPRPYGREVGELDLDLAMDRLAHGIDEGEGSTSMRDAASVVLFALRQRIEAEQAPVPMPKHDKNYTLGKAIDDTGRAVRLNHLGHYTGMVAMVLAELQDRMDDDVEQNVPVDVDPPGLMPGTPLDTESGLRYIAPGGKFAAHWTGEGNGPQLGQVSLLNLRILSAHLTTAIDHVTGELELRRH